MNGNAQLAGDGGTCSRADVGCDGGFEGFGREEGVQSGEVFGCEETEERVAEAGVELVGIDDVIGGGLGSREEDAAVDEEAEER